MDTDLTLTAAKPSTCKVDRRLGKRELWVHVCPDCGSEFMSAGQGSRVYCPACRKARDVESRRKYRVSEAGKKSHNDHAKRWREANPEKARERNRKRFYKNREAHNARRKEYYYAHLEQERERGRLRMRARKGDISAKIEYARLIGRMETCPRMRVTMMHLPCGKRRECWGGKPCERCADMKRPRFEDPSTWVF